MIIETKRLILRPFKMEDVEEFFLISSDKEVQKYLFSYSIKKSIDDFKKLVYEYSLCDFTTNFYFAICDKSTNKIMGALIINRTTFTVLDVSYFIGKDFRNNGYMKEALIGFKDFLSNSSFQYSALELTTSNSNKISQKVIESCGGKKFRNCRDFIIWRIKVDH